MASSVARMPSDDWRHHHPSSRLTAGVLGAHVHSPKPLPKVLTRISTSIDTAAAAAAVAREPCSPATAARRRQSQILDRWAARQAREMITTIERQAHEAELSALSTNIQPVSARAASFLRETSPAFSDSSSVSSAAAVGTAAGCPVASDIPPNVRASSLIQMWRELEAEAGVCPTPRAGAAPAGSTGGVGAFPAEAQTEAALSSADEPSGGSDACDESEAFCDWDSMERVALSSASSVAADNEVAEKRRVGEIVRMLSLKLSSAASSSDESELSAVVTTAAKEPPTNAPPAARSPSLAPVVLNSPSPPPAGGGKALRVRGRREMEELVSRLEEERRREVAALAERRPVSRFPFRGRIQSLIRLRSLRREVATIKHQQRSRKLEAERCQNGSNNLFRREGSEDRRQKDITEVPTDESMSVTADSHDSGYAADPIDNSDGENNHYPELVSSRELESSPQAFYSPQAFFTPLSRHEDLQESHSPDASWDERSLWGSSIDWQRPSDSPILLSWHGEVVTEGTETSTQEQHVASTQCNWLSEASNSWRGWSNSKHNFFQDFLNSNSSENGEIRELLERKAVSNSLASDFSTKMNQIIASFLHRQELQYIDENGREECEEQGIWRQNYESTSDQETTASSLEPLPSEILHNQESWHNATLPLSSQVLQNQEGWQSISLPLSSQMLQYLESWQSASFTQISSPNLQEGEVMHDLKNNIAQVHHELSELRKLVESCLEWQSKLERSIKQEVSSAVNQLTGRGNSLHNSKCMPARKETCCICCEAQVDSLLYRCGHMCACYKCAQELQWSSGRCPICRSLIVDVVRAYPNS